MHLLKYLTVVSTKVPFPTLDESLSFYELRWTVKDRVEVDNLGYFGKTRGVFTILGTLIKDINSK